MIFLSRIVWSPLTSSWQSSELFAQAPSSQPLSRRSEALCDSNADRPLLSPELFHLLDNLALENYIYRAKAEMRRVISEKPKTVSQFLTEAIKAHELIDFLETIVETIRSKPQTVLLSNASLEDHENVKAKADLIARNALHRIFEDEITKLIAQRERLQRSLGERDPSVAIENASLQNRIQELARLSALFREAASHLHHEDPILASRGESPSTPATQSQVEPEIHSIPELTVPPSSNEVPSLNPPQRGKLEKAWWRLKKN